MRIKILHWNIWFQERVENILKLLEEVDADVLLLQEVTKGCEYNNGKDIAKTIGDKLKLNYNFALAHEYTKHCQGNAIFSKFPFSSNSNFLIQEAGEIYSYSTEARSCAVSKIDFGYGKILNFSTTHSSYNRKFTETKAKLEEIGKLIEFFRENNEKLIFSGDLNVAPGSDSIKLIERELVSCGPDYNQATWTTKSFSYDGFKEDRLRWRLDYIFASRDVKIISSKIIETKHSDHLPILLEVEI